MLPDEPQIAQGLFVADDATVQHTLPGQLSPHGLGGDGHAVLLQVVVHLDPGPLDKGAHVTLESTKVLHFSCDFLGICFIKQETCLLFIVISLVAAVLYVDDVAALLPFLEFHQEQVLLHLHAVRQSDMPFDDPPFAQDDLGADAAPVPDALRDEGVLVLGGQRGVAEGVGLDKVRTHLAPRGSLEEALVAMVLTQVTNYGAN